MPVANLAGAIALLASGTYQVWRPGVSSLVDGVAVEAAGESFSILASVQPLSGRERQLLPEGQRSEERLLVVTATELRVADVSARREGDVLVYRGEDFEVEAVERWDELGGFWKARAVKVRR
ncbi:hypothetical protein JYJ95_38010 [Corallococcus exiguus]|uniref:hypothetical protein n=1 Tax=Corallococcus exiguus TaxID=83462 RepID=UPI001A8F5EFF|nr:hypothetical protein [Corallococcus exiguus]MBN8472333.1 hypothetical protein [Corallococcus exiguus]